MTRRRRWQWLDGDAILWLLVLYLRIVSKRFFQNDFIMTEFKYNEVFKVGQFRCHNKSL